MLHTSGRARSENFRVSLDEREHRATALKMAAQIWRPERRPRNSLISGNSSFRGCRAAAAVEAAV